MDLIRIPSLILIPTSLTEIIIRCASRSIYSIHLLNRVVLLTGKYHSTFQGYTPRRNWQCTRN